jgi:hypothetical protein
MLYVRLVYRRVRIVPKKAPITFVMSIRLSVHKYQRGSRWTEFCDTGGLL